MGAIRGSRLLQSTPVGCRERPQYRRTIQHRRRSKPPIRAVSCSIPSRRSRYSMSRVFGASAKRKPWKTSARDLALTPEKSFACIRVSGVVANLLDITDPKRLKPFCDAIAKFAINSDSQELIRNTTLSPMKVIQTPDVLIETLLSLRWRELGMQLGIPSNSQVFGRIAFEAGYDGIVFKSARGGGRCLCIFLENLTHSETVLQLPDPVPSPDTVTELNAGTWTKLVTPFSLKRTASRLLAALR